MADESTPSGHADSDLILVRATVHLQGLRAGEYAYVDPTSPIVADCLAADLLVEVAEEEDETEAAGDRDNAPVGDAAEIPGGPRDA